MVTLVYTAIMFTRVTSDRKTRVHVHETQSLPLFSLLILAVCLSRRDDSRPQPLLRLVSPNRSFGVVLLCISQHNEDTHR